MKGVAIAYIVIASLGICVMLLENFNGAIGGFFTIVAIILGYILAGLALRKAKP